MPFESTVYFVSMTRLQMEIINTSNTDCKFLARCFFKRITARLNFEGSFNNLKIIKVCSFTFYSFWNTSNFAKSTRHGRDWHGPGRQERDHHRAVHRHQPPQQHVRVRQSARRHLQDGQLHEELHEEKRTCSVLKQQLVPSVVWGLALQWTFDQDSLFIRSLCVPLYVN